MLCFVINGRHTAKRAAVVAALVEGMSIRATSRMTGVCKPAILKLLADLGKVCSDYQDKAFRNLPTKRVQADEIWSFCYARRQNVPKEKQGEFGYGDVWTWTAIDADSKLVFSWLVGNRDGESAQFFMNDLAERLAGRVQLTTDRLYAYIRAVDNAFRGEVDFAQLRKVYGSDPQDARGKYAPPVVLAAKKEPVTGRPEFPHINTSYVERQNLTMRMSIKRFARLTNAHSKKLENHVHAIALHFMFYNFCRVHQTLRVTPAMENGIADHVWSIEEQIGLLDAAEQQKVAA
jgi:IS1 family transposase